MVCWKPISVSWMKGTAKGMPSRFKRSPFATLSNDRLTLSGKIRTDCEPCRPSESTTVSVIRYRVNPLKSWPAVGITNVPDFTPVCGRPGWTWPSWRKSMLQVKAEAGSGPSSASLASPLNAIVSPARKSAPSVGLEMTGVGGLPTRMAMGAESVVLFPSETATRAENGPLVA